MSTMTDEAYDALRQGHRKRSHAKQQRRLQLTKTALIGSRTLRKGSVPQFCRDLVKFRVDIIQSIVVMLLLQTGLIAVLVKLL